MPRSMGIPIVYTEMSEAYVPCVLTGVLLLLLALLKAFDVRGHLGRTGTLRCQLRTGRHNRGWIRLTWERIEPDGSPLPVIHLPVRNKIPDWSRQVPSQLKNRIKPLITVQPGHVEFSIEIHNLTCEDESEYRCRAVTPQRELLSVAELRIFARPRVPKITVDFSASQGHSHLHVNCKADVGLPPKTLVWYEKRPQDTQFTIIDGQRHLTEESDGCHVIRTRTMGIPMLRVRPGTRYRCGFPGFIAKKGMYDELLLEEKHFAELQPLNDKRREDLKLKCRKGECQIRRNTQDPNNNASRSLPAHLLNFILSVVAITMTSQLLLVT